MKVAPVIGQEVAPGWPFAPAKIEFREGRIEAFSDWLTAPDNPRFALTIANRLFKRAFGRTPLEHLTRLRVEAAAERLRSDPRASVTDVALDLGFCSSQYFAEVFKRVMGTTPRRWRER